MLGLIFLTLIVIFALIFLLSRTKEETRPDSPKERRR